jgi:murein DD-endopeptidase MepM/ murein hydrolase activator NlpD
MRTTRERRRPVVGPAAVAVIGLVAIVVGVAVKTGYLEVRRSAATAADTPRATPRTATGEVATPPAIPADTPDVAPPVADANAARPTDAELAELARQLIVPVAGLQPKDLLDTFRDARGARQHNALDIPAPRGTPVLAAADGRVLRLYTSDAGGLMIYASDPSDRFVLMYAHLDRYAPGLADGTVVRRGDTIGYVGTTGNAPPNVPHLHFAIARTADVTKWWTGMPVDPLPLLRR